MTRCLLKRSPPPSAIIHTVSLASMNGQTRFGGTATTLNVGSHALQMVRAGGRGDSHRNGFTPFVVTGEEKSTTTIVG